MEEPTKQQNTEHYHGDPLDQRTVEKNENSTTIPPITFHQSLEFYLSQQDTKTCAPKNSNIDDAIDEYHQGNRIPWENLTEKERTSYNHSTLEKAAVHLPPLFVLRKKEIENIELQFQQLRRTAQSLSKIAEEAQANLTYFHPRFLFDEIGTSKEFLELLALARKTAQDSLTAWSESQKFLNHYFRVTKNYHNISFKIKNKLQPETVSAITNWENNLTWYSLFEQEHQSFQLLKTIQSLSSSNHKKIPIATLFRERETAIQHIQKHLTTLSKQYHKQLDQASARNLEMSFQELKRCQQRSLFWEITLAEHKAFEQEVISEAAKKEALVHIDNEPLIQYRDHNFFNTGIAKLKDAIQKTKKTKEAWRAFENVCDTLYDQHPDASIFWEEDLTKAKEKQLLLTAEELYLEAMKTSLLAKQDHEIAWCFINFESKDYKNMQEHSDEVFSKAQTAWLNLEVFCKKHSSKTFENDWNHLLEEAKNEILDTRWYYLNLKLNNTINFKNFIISKDQINQTSSSTFYSKLAENSRLMVSYSESLSSLVQDHLKEIEKLDPQNKNQANQINFWNKEYENIQLIKTNANRDLNEYTTRLNACKKKS